MDDLCTSTAGGEHVKEYYETRGGEIWVRCHHCGNLFFDRYIDCGSGG